MSGRDMRAPGVRWYADGHQMRPPHPPAPEFVTCPACGEEAERLTLRASESTGERICEACWDDEDQDAARYDPTCYGSGMLWDGEE